MTGKNVNIPVGGTTMPAYVAHPPEGSGPHPAVIVLQEIYGINSEMQRIADLVASIGYVGLVINVYHRHDPDFQAAYTPEGSQKGLAAAATITRESIRADVAASMDWLSAQPYVRAGKIATWGFCLGGAMAFVSASLPGLSGAIVFYGSQIVRAFPSGEVEGLADAGKVACPLLIVFGGDDASTPPEQVARVKQTLEAAGKEAHVQVYSNVGHAFFRSSASSASGHASSDQALGEASADAWNQVQAFLRRIFSA
ncbi:MAG: dienelactone hydrolase family protein [Candidatus Eremiobacteraeota bacterium]|nr:dienelactone hydrolase family protein [Candidatus Eremiobacteraeota bacterium]